MNTIVTSIDALLCILVVLAALEYLRAVNVFKHPVLAAAFYLVAIGAFGLVLDMLRGGGASLFSMTLHAGVVLYAWARRQYIFMQDFEFPGYERRSGYQPIGGSGQIKAPPRNP
ncbi:hypothetical protein HNR03_004015 [Pseudomonas sp. JAI111]|uniref:hypothetical protein n=1 Tax=Pseudomonas sp. JAI111 TaxID=2735913 RepID=UPI00216A753B|nr:hypothetical protein [Pseudomonas sp. JAI111]MCS3839404.1 hypothetical protein [Pseudomonas sp. JAI111]